ncbi:tetratricopeptide repeat protein [Streptomyces sp. NPDC055607]
MTEITRSELLAAAARLRDKGGPDQALLYLLDLSVQYPDDPETAYQTALTHDVLGLEAEAVPFYEDSLDRPGLSTESRRNAFMALGNAYRALGRYEDVLRTLRKATDEFRNDVSLHTLLGIAVLDLRHHHEAALVILDLLPAKGGDAHVHRYRRAVEQYARELRVLVRGRGDPEGDGAADARSPAPRTVRPRAGAGGRPRIRVRAYRRSR